MFKYQPLTQHSCHFKVGVGVWPLGFDWDTMASWMLTRKLMHQMMGGSALLAPNQTPPAPVLHASQ